MRKLILAVFAVLVAVSAVAQTEIKVEAPNVVAADEQFNVTFIIEGEDNPTDFHWSPGDAFQVLWGPQSGHSTSIQIVNGKRTKSVQSTYTYVLRPTGTGRFNIPVAEAEVKGRKIASRPVAIQVAAAGAASSSSSAPSSSQSSSRQTGQVSGISDGDIFLRMNLSRTDVVEGEPITATLKLYQRVNIAGFENVSFPSFNGFWSQEVEAPTNIEFTREVLDGQIYNAALLRKFVIIPQQKGQLKVNPAEMVCLVNVRVSSAGHSIFDGFFDDYRTVRKKVASNPVTVNVSSLPAGAPSSFAGGVGSFNISARLSKDTLKTHEAASLIVTVSGRGNISLLETPDVSFPPDMEVYDTKISDKVDKGGLSGSKQYEFPFIPRSYGDFVIAPIGYSYYDIDKQSYVTLKTPPVPFTVEKGAETDAGGVIVASPSQKDVRTLGNDIRFISTRNPELVPEGRFFVGSALFWILLVVLSAISMALWAVFRKLAARKADVAGSKNRRARKMALKRLKLADTFLRQNLYTAFYEELHKALLGFVSDKFNMPASELSRDRISDEMKAYGVGEELMGTFMALLDSCEFARYAPDAGHEAMSAHYDSALNVITSIDSQMKENKSAAGHVALALLMLMALPSALSANESAYPDSLWNAANAAYSEGRWSDAIDGYMMISDLGLESPALYCNTGDAFFKDGNIPMAILYYERALKLDPSYSDARFNLELMNSLIQDRIDPVPEFILKTWFLKVCYMMDSDSWAVLFIVFVGLTLACLLLFLLSPGIALRRTGFFTGIAVLILSVFSIVFSLWQKNGYMSDDEAIVMRPVVSVKSSPSSESSTDLFILHEGTKVRVIDEVGGWNNVELADGRQGWMSVSDLEVI